MLDSCDKGGAEFCAHHEKVTWLTEEQERVNSRIEMQIQTLREEIQTKTPLKLFYTIITTFTALYVFGVVAVYSKVHQNSLDFYKGIAMIQITETEIKERMAHTILQGDRMEKELGELRKNLRKSVADVRRERFSERGSKCCMLIIRMWCGTGKGGRIFDPLKGTCIVRAAVSSI